MTIEDKNAAPDDKKLIQMVSDKIGKEFIATAEDNKTLRVMFDLEQLIGKEIIWLNERSYDSLFREKRIFGGKPNRLPSWARRYCTTELKLVPIFKYTMLRLMQHETDFVEMRIGYRADERHRKDKFIENKNDHIRFPIACNITGTRRQILKTYLWRVPNFPLIDVEPVSNFEIIKYWRDKSIDFPPQSNCAGCFHKDEVSLHLQWKNAPNQMRWFAEQEKKGMGTWLDSNLTFERIRDMKFTIPIDFSSAGISCQGGCTD